MREFIIMVLFGVMLVTFATIFLAPLLGLIPFVGPAASTLAGMGVSIILLSAAAVGFLTYRWIGLLAALAGMFFLLWILGLV